MNTFEWIKRAEAAEAELHDLKQAALVEGQRLREALAEALADKNYAEGQLREAQSERDLFSSTVDDQDVALIEARRQLHELSVKYVCALRRLREMGDALEMLLCGEEPYVAEQLARAVLALQRKNGTDE
jgi:DNA polymerase/3'-5' exonuclease PolX